MSLDDLFCDIDDFCRLFLPAWHRQRLTSGERKRQRTTRSSLSEIMMIMINRDIPLARHWAPINPLNYESTQMSDIHVIGDAQGTGQPKSGHIATPKPRCIDTILRTFAGEAPDPAPTTNSACHSPITANTASWLTAVFAYNPNTGASWKSCRSPSAKRPRPPRTTTRKCLTGPTICSPNPSPERRVHQNFTTSD